MTTTSPEQTEAAYAYLAYCRAELTPTVLLDSIRISKLNLSPKQGFVERVKYNYDQQLKAAKDFFKKAH